MYVYGIPLKDCQFLLQSQITEFGEDGHVWQRGVIAGRSP